MQRKVFLRLLFECTSTEDLWNLIITLIRNMGGNLKVKDYLVGAKDVIIDARMVHIESPVLKKMSNLCAGRVLVILHPSLYKALKIMFLTDVGSIVSEWKNLGQYFRVFTPIDFYPVCI